MDANPPRFAWICARTFRTGCRCGRVGVRWWQVGSCNLRHQLDCRCTSSTSEGVKSFVCKTRTGGRLAAFGCGSALAVPSLRTSPSYFRNAQQEWLQRRIATSGLSPHFVRFKLFPSHLQWLSCDDHDATVYFSNLNGQTLICAYQNTPLLVLLSL
eukprot:4036010-Pleurochrysis_carterae.AAC.2